MGRFPILLGGCLVACLLSACASNPSQIPTNDRFEQINRVTYRFNETADEWVLRPVAVTYDRVTPSPIQRGIGNFFSNLGEPIRFVNNLLQAKPRQAVTDLGRFVLNSTFGILGLFDLATDWAGWSKSDEDFGQTLGYWGVPMGWYVVVPLYGGTSIRDGVGAIADWQLNLLETIDEERVEWALLGLRVVDLRAGLLDADQTLKTVYDPYAFVRDAYFQRRLAKVYDGNPPPPSMEWPDNGKMTPPWENN
jgi:phospholipid-binding lipoprotein MlaA